MTWFQTSYYFFLQKENGCCDLPVADLTITMLLRRRTYYYVMSLILPCTLIACTIFLEFILPAESGERVGLGITILLSMAVFQELTSEKLPSSSEHFPLLGKGHLGIKRWWQKRTQCCGYIVAHDCFYAAQTGEHLL